MKKFMKLLAIIGFCGVGMLILFSILNLHTVATIGLVVFFVCVAGVVACGLIKGYNPAEP
jgi:hypothetical protein